MVYLETISQNDTTVVLAGVVEGEHVVRYMLRGLDPTQVAALLCDIDAADDVESVLIAWTTMLQMEETRCFPKD